MSYSSLYLEWIFENINKNSKILEIGSGNSSVLLQEKGYTVYSIDENNEWVGLCNECVYCYSPLINYPSGTIWYDRDIIKNFLLDKEYDLIIIDGPSCSECVKEGFDELLREVIMVASPHRIGFYENIDLFNPNVIIVFDDTLREEDNLNMVKVKEKLNKQIIYNDLTWENSYIVLK